MFSISTKLIIPSWHTVVWVIYRDYQRWKLSDTREGVHATEWNSNLEIPNFLRLQLSRPLRETLFSRYFSIGGNGRYNGDAMWPTGEV
jgi:hypothetical protein